MSRTYRRKTISWLAKYEIERIINDPTGYCDWLNCRDGNTEYLIHVFLKYYHSDSYRERNKSPRWYTFSKETKPLRLKNNRKLRTFNLDELEIFETRLYFPYY